MADVTIRRRADDCLDQFRLLIRFENEVQEGDKAGRNEKDYELSRTQEQLARFEMWTGNVGALADGHASLDYRVRNSEDAKQLVVEFLGTLLLALRGGKLTLVAPLFMLTTDFGSYRNTQTQSSSVAER
jgi:hypothetical protein